MGHALPGCFVFGAFTAKMLLLRAERSPDRLPSVVGGPVVRRRRCRGRRQRLCSFEQSG
ncbi:DUF6529 family protein [Streptomyces sp. ME01-24h]|nr:DUF6529 family protein [Streptomyces sp. ME19-03-3]MDX3353016.1 DUF6529 family protein [Streptomyces sp. ME01-24h]